MAKKKYDNDSIVSLKGAERVRTRPAVIFGSDDREGCCHSFFEIVSNAIDEFKGGFGNKIIVTAYRDHSLEVTDFGRGIPVDYNGNYYFAKCTPAENMKKRILTMPMLWD